MSLRQADINQFKEQGFLPYNDMLTPLEVKALHQRLEDIGNEVVAFPPKYVEIEPKVVRGEEETDPVRFNNVRKIWNLTKHDPLFMELARHPKILEAVRSLIGQDLKIYVDQTLCKPPRLGSAKPPHQDSAYWTTIDPPHLVICWIALDEATEENGCMRFISGSHKLGVIEHKHLDALANAKPLARHLLRARQKTLDLSETDDQVRAFTEITPGVGAGHSTRV